MDDTVRIRLPRSAAQLALEKIERTAARHGLLNEACALAGDDRKSHHKCQARNRKWLEWYLKLDVQGKEVSAVCELSFQALGTRQEVSIGIHFCAKDLRWSIWTSNNLGKKWVQWLMDGLGLEERESNALESAQAMQILNTLVWYFRNPLY
jgi:hypothetical protein